MIVQRKNLFILTVSVTALAATGPADAQDSTAQAAAESGLDEIMVTAEKRATALQETPLAVTALRGDALEDRHIANVEDLTQAIPNVNFGQTTGNARIAIRGVGFDNITVGNEGRVAYHLDGVYISRPIAALGTFFDVDRVEVLRGPQGSIYGRNATAGAVNVITSTAEDRLGGYGRLTIGNYDLVKTEGAINAPLGSTLAVRIAFQTTDRDGYGRNLITGRDIDDEKTRSIRGKLRWKPADRVEFDLSADYRKEDDSNYGYHYLGRGSATVEPLGLRLGGVVARDRRDLTADVQPSNNRMIWGTAFSASIDFGPVLTSISGYRESRFHQIADLDTTSVRLANFDQFERSRQFSQELRLTGDFAGGEWLIGGYYFDEAIEGGTGVAFDRLVLGAPAQLVQGLFIGGSIDAKALAAFGQVKVNLTDSLALIGATRYSTEKKRIDELNALDFVRPYSPTNPVVPQRSQQDSQRWSAFTPKLGLEYKPSDDIFVYVTASKGFKSGGYNLGGIQPAFRPEILWDYEAGVKSDLFDGTMRANVSAFLYEYKNLQVSRVQGTAIVIENAARAQLKGIEGELVFLPTRNLQFDLNFSLLDTKYKEFRTADPSRPELGVLDLSGNKLTQAPTYTISLGAQYSWDIGDGELTARGEGYFVDRIYFSPFNSARTSQGEASRFNAFLNFKTASERLTASLFVRNITNKQQLGTAAISTGLTGFPVIGTLQPPRTYGVQTGFRF